MSLVFGGPAWQAGIRPGDRIVSVEGLETSGRKISEIVSQFRGEVGSKVNLGIRRQDVSTNELLAAQDIMISRQNIRIESVRGDRRLPSGKWDWWLEGNSRIAYLRITYFGNRTSLEITELIEQL